MRKTVTNQPVFTQAPLPFMGQKRRWNNEFKTAISTHFTDCYTFVDLFGGSGLLSHFVRNVRPDAQIVYNDFDGYTQRIEAIPTTNLILAELRRITKDVPRHKAITGARREQILDIIRKYDKRGFVDYITLSTSILFSAKYATSLAELEKQTLYNTIRQNDYTADNYLQGITIVHQDYKDLFRRYQNDDGVCFLIDPPYLSTQATTYSCYWKLKDYLDVLHTLNGTNYFYFTSNKSDIIELCDWLHKEYNTANPFDGATCIVQNAQLNYNSQYMDIMLYKHIYKQERRAA